MHQIYLHGVIRGINIQELTGPLTDHPASEQYYHSSKTKDSRLYFINFTLRITIDEITYFFLRFEFYIKPLITSVTVSLQHQHK